MPDQQKKHSPETTLKVEYRTADFMILFLRRQFERTVVWVIHLLLVATAGMAVIYAVALAASGQTEQLSQNLVWLLIPVALLVLAVLAVLYVSYANARVLKEFYHEDGSQVLLRMSDKGIGMQNSKGTVFTSWSEISKHEVRRSGLVFWKGTTLPLVFPVRILTDDVRARLSEHARELDHSELIEQVQPDAVEPEAGQGTPQNQTSEAMAVQESSQVMADDVPSMPDYSDSEYQFGDDWVADGIRFRFDVLAEDREGLMEYSLVRPGTRRLMVVLALVSMLLSIFMVYTYTNASSDIRTTMLLFIILAALFSLLFWTGVFHPVMFMRIARRFSGRNRRRRHDAVRNIICVLSDDVMYMKTEGQAEKVPVASFHEIRHYKNWLFLFKNKKTAYVIPLRALDHQTQTDLFEALGDHVR